MTALEVINSFSNVNTGGIVAGIVILLTLVEITPIKISPLAWIGRRLNKETLNKVENVEKKLDEHIAGSYRSAIFKFCDDVQTGVPKNKEQWKEIINAISKYREHCEANNVNNGLCEQASEYLEEEYHEHLRKKDFAPDLSKPMTASK